MQKRLDIGGEREGGVGVYGRGKNRIPSERGVGGPAPLGHANFKRASVGIGIVRALRPGADVLAGNDRVGPDLLVGVFQSIALCV